MPKKTRKTSPDPDSQVWQEVSTPYKPQCRVGPGARSESQRGQSEEAEAEEATDPVQVSTPNSGPHRKGHRSGIEGSRRKLGD